MNYNKNYIQYISGIINEETYYLRENEMQNYYNQNTETYLFKIGDEINFNDPHGEGQKRGKIIKIKSDYNQNNNEEMPQNKETVIEVDSNGKVISINIGEINENDPMLRRRKILAKKY
jgi:hypothetical protein